MAETEVAEAGFDERGERFLDFDAEGVFFFLRRSELRRVGSFGQGEKFESFGGGELEDFGDVFSVIAVIEGGVGIAFSLADRAGEKKIG